MYCGFWGASRRHQHSTAKHKAGASSIQVKQSHSMACSGTLTHQRSAALLVPTRPEFTTDQYNHPDSRKQQPPLDHLSVNTTTTPTSHTVQCASPPSSLSHGSQPPPNSTSSFPSLYAFLGAAFLAFFAGPAIFAPLRFMGAFLTAAGFLAFFMAAAFLSAICVECVCRCRCMRGHNVDV